MGTKARAGIIMITAVLLFGASVSVRGDTVQDTSATREMEREKRIEEHKQRIERTIKEHRDRRAARDNGSTRSRNLGRVFAEDGATTAERPLPEGDREQRIKEHSDRIRYIIEEGNRRRAQSGNTSNSVNTTSVVPPPEPQSPFPVPSQEMYDGSTTAGKSFSEEERRRNTKEHNDRIRYIIEDSKWRLAQIEGTSATAPTNPQAMSPQEREAFINRLKAERERDAARTTETLPSSEREMRVRETNRHIREIILEKERRQGSENASTSGSM